MRFQSVEPIKIDRTRMAKFDSEALYTWFDKIRESIIIIYGAKDLSRCGSPSDGRSIGH